jgi:hypothetical protein
MNMREVAVWLVRCSARVLSGGGVVPGAAAQTAHRTTRSLDGSGTGSIATEVLLR